MKIFINLKLKKEKYKMIKKFLNKKKLLLLVSFFYLFTNINVYGMDQQEQKIDILEEQNLKIDDNNQVQNDQKQEQQAVDSQFQDNKQNKIEEKSIELDFIKKELTAKEKGKKKPI